MAVEFSHAECSPSHADLAALVVLAGAEPLGIQYAQALHPEAGAVLLWERMLDVRVRAGGEGSDEQYLYLDTDEGSVRGAVSGITSAWLAPGP